MEMEEIDRLVRRLDTINYLHAYGITRHARKEKKQAERKLLGNQESLKRFVKSAFDHRVLYSKYYTSITRAIRYITDEEFLKRLALKAQWATHRQAAIINPNLKDEKALAKIALRPISGFSNVTDRNKAETQCNIFRAINKINDDKQLEKIARYGDKRVRPKALRKITSEEILTDFALNNDSSRLREIAAGKISNQKVVCKILRQPNTCDVMKSAIRRSTNQEFLKSTALNEKLAHDRKSIWYCVAAISAITDEDILTYIAQTSRYPLLRKSAIGNPNLKDEDVLIDFLRYDVSAEVRMEAVKKITRQDALIDAALHEDSPKIIIEAVKRINSKNALREIIANNRYASDPASARLEALNRLSKKRQLKLLNGE